MEAEGQVERRLAEEADRTAHYLSSFTHVPLQSLLIEHLLTAHLSSILNMPGTGLVVMLDGDRMSDLRRLYTLFLKVPEDAGKLALRIALRSDIEERGRGINEGVTNEAGPSGANAGEGDAEGGGGDEADDPKGKGRAKAAGSSGAAGALANALRWVQDVLDLKDKFDRIWEEAFAGDKAIQTSINEVSHLIESSAGADHKAFQSFINANQRAPEYLSLYIDEHLKKGSKAVGVLCLVRKDC